MKRIVLIVLILLTVIILQQIIINDYKLAIEIYKPLVKDYKESLVTELDSLEFILEDITGIYLSSITVESASFLSINLENISISDIEKFRDKNKNAIDYSDVYVRYDGEEYTMTFNEFIKRITEGE